MPRRFCWGFAQEIITVGLGWLVYDLTGSYAAIWILTAASGAVAALLHFPIRDTTAGSPATAARA